jgi:hypothetical protein
VGRNVLLTTNKFKLVGKPVKTPRSVLVKPAKIGDSFITVQSADGWVKGAEIVITTTSGDFKAHDKQTIEEVTGNMVKLANTLKHYHWGAAEPNTTAYGTIDMRA